MKIENWGVFPLLQWHAFWSIFRHSSSAFPCLPPASRVKTSSIYQKNNKPTPCLYLHYTTNCLFFSRFFMVWNINTMYNKNVNISSYFCLSAQKIFSTNFLFFWLIFLPPCPCLNHPAPRCARYVTARCFATSPHLNIRAHLHTAKSAVCFFRKHFQAVSHKLLLELKTKRSAIWQSIIYL